VTATGPETSEGFALASSRIGMNLAALALARFATMAMTFVQMGIIFRKLGVEGSGQFVFALGYASLFTVLATLGIQRLLVRDIARNPDIAWTYVWTATVVVAVMSIVAFCTITGSILIFEANAVVRRAVMLASLSFVVLWAVQSPFEALLTARERMIFIAIVYVIAGALKLAGIYIVLQRIPSSAAAHGTIVVANLITFLLCIAFTIHVAGWERPRVRLSLAIDQVRQCFPFMVAMICSQIYVKSDMSILKFMQGNAAAGLYGPAQRIVEPILMIASIWGRAVFPALCRFSVDSPENYARLKQTSLRFALLIAFPMAFGIACLAGPIVALLAGDGYADSVVVLRILCVIIPLLYLNGVGQEFFYASHRNWFVVRAYALAGVVSVTVNLVAIPHLGVRGVTVAAIAANSLISVLFIRGMLAEFGAMGLVSLVAKTLIACVTMALVVYALAGTSLVISIGAGILVYTFIQIVLRTLNPEERRLIGRLAGLPLRPSKQA